MIDTELNKDIFDFIEEITNHLATLTKKERISWFKKNMYIEPLNFVKEIDGLIQKLYEDNAIGKISDERYVTMALSYEEEQLELKNALPEMQRYLETDQDTLTASEFS